MLKVLLMVQVVVIKTAVAGVGPYKSSKSRHSACPLNPESSAIDMLRFLMMVQVVIIKTAVAGIGPYNRKWPGPPETADRCGLSCCKMHCCWATIYHVMHTTVVAAQRLLLFFC